MKMFPKLFSPVRIGGLEIKNRVAMTAMGVNLAAAGGAVGLLPWGAGRQPRPPQGAASTSAGQGGKRP